VRASMQQLLNFCPCLCSVFCHWCSYWSPYARSLVLMPDVPYAIPCCQFTNTRTFSLHAFSFSPQYTTHCHSVWVTTASGSLRN
jgi:hypothetical protein